MQLWSGAMASPATPPRATPRLPPRRPIGLAGLRAFESAARQLSFTHAAAELVRTPSSISRQIAALEHQVGQPLFVRRTRALELTAAGERLLAVVAPALTAIDRRVDELRGRQHPPRVSVTTYASFASLWLVPRLAAFRQQEPGVEIRIDASDRHVDLVGEGIDVAIRLCPPGAAGSDAVLLDAEGATPALAPSLLERSGVALREPADLLRLPVIDMDDPTPGSRAGHWARWLALADVAPSAAGSTRMVFGFVDQAMQAAIRGQGVAMGYSLMVDGAVAAGSLLLPFPDLRIATGSSYHLLVNPRTRDAPPVRAFAEWLVQEFARGAGS
jgi:LysR family glycine cleavage system transcriptional activator